MIKRRLKHISEVECVWIVDIQLSPVGKLLDSHSMEETVYLMCLFFLQAQFHIKNEQSSLA